MKRLCFKKNMLFIEHPNPTVQEILNEKFQEMKSAQPSESIFLNHETSAQFLFNFNRVFFIKKDYDGRKKNHNANQELLLKSFDEFLKNTDLWLILWERNSNMNFDEELKDKPNWSGNTNKVLVLFLFYVQMIHMIIVPHEYHKSENTTILVLFRNAMESFKESTNYFPKQNESSWLKMYPALIWKSLEHWILRSARNEIREIAIGERKNVHPNFKVFFNAVFRASHKNLNVQLMNGLKYN
ncbi:hypothetical protein PGT21_023270 [Puccinia graminis f. sp. tritici]|uniref:Uncharacterized protein n=1 Tax=Puccinia graminis f. sp. tritici TaxID=56615 RepID=A0A5B0LQN9_PUCGR|nr:hypothetical protein PGT21_023270 [Puccinia graminis f. sp. tritici]